jgi:hypothetical protein
MVGTLTAALPAARAEGVYGTNPSAVMKLAQGFLPSKALGKGKCIDESDKSPSSNPSGGRVEYESHVVNDIESLHKETRVDTSLDATLGFASASYGFSLDKEVSSNSSDLMWVFRAFQDYGQKSMVAPIANDYGKGARTLADFEGRCGTEFVFSEHRVAQISAVFVAHDVANHERGDMSRTFNAQVSGFTGSGKFSDSYRESLSKTIEHHVIDVKILAHGGSGIRELKTITALDGQKSLTELEAIISDYIHTFSFDNSLAVEITTRTYDGLGYDFAPTEEFSRTATVLKSLYTPYLRFKADADRLNLLVWGTGEDGQLIKPTDREAYQRQYDESVKRRDDVLARGQACVSSAKACDDKNLPLPLDIAWPEQDETCKQHSAGACTFFVIPIPINNESPGFTRKVVVRGLPLDQEATANLSGTLVVSQSGLAESIPDSLTVLSLYSPGAADPCPVQDKCANLSVQSQPKWKPASLTLEHQSIVGGTANFVVAVQNCARTFDPGVRCTLQDGRLVVRAMAKK